MQIVYILLMLITLTYSCSSNKSSIENQSNPAPQEKLDTDEKALKALNKEKGSELSDRDVCFARSDQFQELILIGYFAYDRGCAGNECFYKSRLTDIKSVSQQVMQDKGWSKEDLRLDLALSYLKFYANSWSSVVTKKHEDFDLEKVDFFAPFAEKVGDNTVATAWIRKPAGMRKARSYYKLQFVFDSSGALTSMFKKSQFSHDY